MTYFPRLQRDWNNKTWQPKFYGGRRLPRRLKKQFKRYTFMWFEPMSGPERWLPGTFGKYPALRNYRYDSKDCL